MKLAVLLATAVAALGLCCHGQRNGLEESVGSYKCGRVPINLIRCIDPPQLLPEAWAIPCLNSQQPDECSVVRCTLNNAGWLRHGRVDLSRVSAFFEEVADHYPLWKKSVDYVNKTCLVPDLPPQGTVLNCPAMDILMCTTLRFLRYVPDSKVRQTRDCQETKWILKNCPLCQDECLDTNAPTQGCHCRYL